MKTLFLATLVLGSLSSFSSVPKKIKTIMTCVDEDSLDRAAVYKSESGELLGVAIEQDDSNDRMYIAFHDAVKLINASPSRGRSGVYMSDGGLFELRELADGSCYVLVNGIGTSTPKFALRGRPQFNSFISIDE